MTIFGEKLEISLINLSLLLTDPMFYYHACWASSKMKLKSQLAEYMAVGLMTVLVDMPYDITSIKYVHWIWHDTDPNICTSNSINGINILISFYFLTVYCFN